MSATVSVLTVTQVMQDQSASQWLKTSLHTALERDPVDALNDALVLAGLLEDRLRAHLGIDDDS
jgi:hypothetical protein